MLQNDFDTKEEIRIEALKLEMSQLFADDSKVIPYTNLKLTNTDMIKYFKGLDIKTPIRLEGLTKGRGFTGTVKKWGFRAGPKSHGHLYPRRPGSIGSQGQGRVIPGKKMAGRMGNAKRTVHGFILGIDEENGVLKFKGAVPGSRTSKVYLYLTKPNEN
jgi:hypothetical protein